MGANRWIVGLVGLALVVCAAGVVDAAVHFADDFEGSTLDPFWTPHAQSGSITFPSTAQAHSGSQSIQFNSIQGAERKNIGIEHDLAKPNINTRLCLDTTKSKSSLGWSPKVSLDEGIQKTR